MLQIEFCPGPRFTYLADKLTPSWLKGNPIMERMGKYTRVLKNEVLVTGSNIQQLFDNKSVYVFGWKGRGMMVPPKRHSLIECELNGFERGPYGIFGFLNYYGIIRSSEKKCNGVLCQITSIRDWANLMRTEMVAGLASFVNYRVVDVTDSISNISHPHKMQKPYVVHCVCNRPSNRQKMQFSKPAPGYYNRVWDGIQRERSSEFIEMFKRTGGFESDHEVKDHILTMTEEQK